MQCLILGTVDRVCVLLAEAPRVEHARQELLPAELIAEILLLDLHLDRLESLLVPLFDRNAHPVLAQTLNSLHELLEGVVAASVEFAVLEKLIHCLLLATLEHLLHQAEEYFRDEQFIVVSVVAMHLCFLSLDIIDTVVIGATQLLKLALQLVSLI